MSTTTRRFLLDSPYHPPLFLTIVSLTLLFIMSILVCLWQISVTIFRSLPYLIDVFNLVERKLNLYLIDLTIGRHLLIFMRLWIWIYGRRRFVPWTLISFWTPLTRNFIHSTASISFWSLKELEYTKLSLSHG